MLSLSTQQGALARSPKSGHEFCGLTEFDNGFRTNTVEVPRELIIEALHLLPSTQIE